MRTFSRTAASGAVALGRWIGWRSAAIVLFATVASLLPWARAGAIAAEPCTKAAARVAESADRRTTREIERRIAADATVGAFAAAVRVTTVDGVVTLRGAIARDEDRLVLASLAESAPGVRSVDDRLEVRPWVAPPSASRAR